MAGRAVVAVLDRIGRLLTLDDQDNLVVHDPTTGRMLAMAASNAPLKGSSDGNFSSSNAPDLVVDQAGEAVTVARVTNVPYQNNVSGASDGRR
jgi:hypothetical protein